MRKRMSVAVRMLAALSMVLSLLGAWAVGVSAAPSPGDDQETYWDGTVFPPLFGAAPSDDICAVSDCLFFRDDFNDGAQEVYFPAVGNADASTGLGAAQTSITVQNIDDEDIYLFLYVGTPEDDDGVDLDNWEAVEVAYLAAGAAKTFQGSDLEIPAGEVRPVVAVGYIQAWYDDEEDVTVLEAATIAGVAKQAVTGDSLPFTTTADSAVSGYNAIGGRELGFFDELSFPIVQTNCGPGGCWNSILRIANMGMDDNAAVTVRFFPADDGSGSLQTGFQLQGLVDVGETWSIDLSEWVPEGWVGSAHIYTDDAVGAIVDRVKPGTNMWITNTANNMTSEHAWQDWNGRFILFAPDVRTDYNGWNTGINIANMDIIDADVTIQYFGSNGNAPLAQTRRIAPQGMTYVYNPSDPSEDRCNQPASDVPGCEFIGGAVIISNALLTVAVDGVKYFGNDANVGQAFSYAATGNGYTTLNAALVQKGNPANGNGATSGINFLNPNAAATTVETTWLNPSGFGASNFGSSVVWVPAYATGFVYTMFHHNLPNGYVGSAIVNSTLPVVGTTANVDYQVDGDGTAIWNLSNPCGFFRQSGECVYDAPIGPLPTNATLTVEVFVENPFIGAEEPELPRPVMAPLAASEAVERTPLAGTLVTYTGGDNLSGSGFTGSNGTVTFAVTAGVYTVTLTDLPPAPAGYVYTGNLSVSDVEVGANSATTVSLVLTLAVAEGTGTLTKVITNLPAEYTSLESAVYFCPVVVADPSAFNSCVGTAVVSGGFGEDGMADNTVSADVPAGVYTICFDVDVSLGNDYIGAYDCEWTYTNADDELVQIIVLDGQETVVVNDFDAQSEALMSIYVRDDESDLPIIGAEVCIYDVENDNELYGCYGTLDDVIDGQVFIYLPASTYRIAVSADGYETEATLIVYSPVADAADGGTADYGPDSDVVVSLDPAPAILNIIALFDQVRVLGALISVHELDTESIVNEVPGCTGLLIASGATDGNGEYSVPLDAGTYCVSAFLLGSSEGTQTANVTVEVGDSDSTPDYTFSFTPAQQAPCSAPNSLNMDSDVNKEVC